MLQCRELWKIIAISTSMRFTPQDRRIRMQYKIVGNEDGSQTIAVFHNGEIYSAKDYPPNWDAIVTAALEGDESIVELFDVAQTIATSFESVSERVSVANNRVYFDGV